MTSEGRTEENGSENQCKSTKDTIIDIEHHRIKNQHI